MTATTVTVGRGLAVFAASIETMAAAAEAADAAGFDSVWTAELYNRSATVTLAALAQHTRSCVLGSGIMYGVARSPVMLAAEARDLDELSHGRLILGLGNGTRRMISDWHGQDPEGPATRIEELVPLVRRLWRLNDGPVDHDGRFYRCKIAALDQLTEPPVRDIPIFTAGVNPRMMESAGRVSDGLLGHTLFSPRYIEDVALPAIARGAAHAGRDPADVSFIAMVLASVSDDEERARRDAAAMIAFYGSVKTYANVFAVSGFADEAQQIRDAFRARDTTAMIAAVTDGMIDTFAVAGTPQQVNAQLRRYDGLAQQVVLFPPAFQVDEERVTENLAMLTQHCTPGHVHH
jgi:probable F420-dependent oxidoreductase